jgi:hypothetical protein
VDALSDKSNKM